MTFPQDTTESRFERKDSDRGATMRVSLRSTAQPASMTFEKFASAQMSPAPLSRTQQEAPARWPLEHSEPSKIAGLPTPSSSFHLHRFLILALAHGAAARPDAPQTGGAVLMRVVYPPVANDNDLGDGSEEGMDKTDLAESDIPPASWRPSDASFDPHVAVQLFDTAATLSAPHPLYETLLNWAPVPQAFADANISRHATNQRSVVHLAFAPRMPGDPILVMSVNAAGQYAAHMHFQSEWKVCDRAESVTDALRLAHLKTAGLPTPACDQELQDVHDQLRIHALARRAVAITMGDIGANQPHISADLMGKSPLTNTAPCVTPHDIQNTFAGLVVLVALRETQRHYERVRHPLGLWD